MLTNRQILALAHWTGIDQRTIARWYAGFTIRKENAVRLAGAVREHDLPRPPHMPRKATYAKRVG